MAKSAAKAYNITGGDIMLKRDLKKEFAKLSVRAKQIKADPNLRHAPNEHDIKESLENAMLLAPYQYLAITKEREDDGV